MAATGYFANPLANTLLARSRVIYKAPSTPPVSGGTIPINRLPSTPAPQQPGVRPTVPTAVYPVNVATGDPVIQTVSTFGTGTSGGGNTSGTTTTTTTPGTTTGAGTDTGSGGTGTDSRLLDLLAGAFKSQDISQPYGPVASGPTQVASSGGPNPVALLVLGIIAVLGVMWYMKRQKRNAA